jgi:DNA primase catalytic core
MARIAEEEIARLKAEVSMQRLVEAAGIALKKSGKDWLGACPFHEDGTPSLVVTPSKNLWHCFGCGAGGGPIDWAMKQNGVSFRHAVELLREGIASLAAEPVKHTSVRALPAPVSLEADDQALLNQTIDYYHATLKQSPEALAYLQTRGLDHPELIEHFQLGFANRTLGLRLPEKNRKAGAEIRTRLQRIGIYRESGHEHFNGSLIVPVIDERGIVTEVYGRKITEGLRKGTPSHLYLPGPHRGVFNVQALMASKEIILCEALLDALTFWCAGYRNVTSSFGIEGFTGDMLAAFKQYGTERVLIAYDRDDAGERGAAKVAECLMAEGIECFRIQFPKGMDANEYAQKVTPAAKSLGMLIRKAEWLGKGDAPPLTLRMVCPGALAQAWHTQRQKHSQGYSARSCLACGRASPSACALRALANITPHQPQPRSLHAVQAAVSSCTASDSVLDWCAVKGPLRRCAPLTEQPPARRGQAAKENGLPARARAECASRENCNEKGKPVFVRAPQAVDASREFACAYDECASGKPRQYTGRENDGTGLYYYRHRYYSPVLQRFISEDPIKLAGGINTYAYVRGNPVSLTDPLGLWAASVEFYDLLGGGITFGKDPTTGQGFITIRVGVGLGGGAQYDPNGGRPGSDSYCKKNGDGGGMTVGWQVNAGGGASVWGAGVSGGVGGGAGYDFGSSNTYKDNLSPSYSVGYTPGGKTEFGIGGSIGFEVGVHDKGDKKCGCQ